MTHPEPEGRSVASGPRAEPSRRAIALGVVIVISLLVIPSVYLVDSIRHHMGPTEVRLPPARNEADLRQLDRLAGRRVLVAEGTLRRAHLLSVRDHPSKPEDSLDRCIAEFALTIDRWTRGDGPREVIVHRGVAFAEPSCSAQASTDWTDRSATFDTIHVGERYRVVVLPDKLFGGNHYDLVSRQVEGIQPLATGVNAARHIDNASATAVQTGRPGEMGQCCGRVVTDAQP